MSKKEYQKPALRVVILQHQTHLLAGSVNDIGGDEFNYGGGGNGPGR